jgi:VCBS repeat-containing protein
MSFSKCPRCVSIPHVGMSLDDACGWAAFSLPATLRVAMQAGATRLLQNARLRRSRATLHLFISTMLLLTLPFAAPAATRDVGSGHTYATIQAAVNAAQPGDVISIYPGTYGENVDLSLMGTPGNISFSAASGPGTVRWSGSNEKLYHSSAFNFSVAVTNISFESSNADAVSLTNVASCSFSGCWFGGGTNSIDDYAIQLSLSGGNRSILVNNCVFSNRGVKVWGTGAVNVNGSVNGCWFTNLCNESVRFQSDDSSVFAVSANNNTIRNSRGTWPAIFFLARDTSTMTVTAQGNDVANLMNSDGIVARAIRGGSVLSGDISGNTLTSVGTNAYDRGIWVDVNPSPASGPQGNFQIYNNTINGSGGNGLKIRVMNDTNRWTLCAMDMTVTNNTMSSGSRAEAGGVGMQAEVGTAQGSYGELWLNLRGNVSTQGYKLVHGDGLNGGKFVVPGNASLLALTNDQIAQAHVQSFNTGAVTVQGMVRINGAAADAKTLLEDTNVICNVLTNEWDHHGERHTLRISNVTSPTYGTVSIRSGNTNLLYTPSTNFNGSDSFTYTVHNGVDWTNTATVYMTVTPVNDPPGFTKGTNDVVYEDCGLWTSNGWATAISPGPTADESTQAVWFVASNNNARLFITQPTVTVSGALSYQPAANSNGTATIWVWLRDNGGTTNGGISVSATQSFTITVNPVNDAPSFLMGAHPTSGEDTGLWVATNWASFISAGPADESAQVMSFIVTNDRPDLFVLQPTITAAGVLSYRSAPDSNGTANVFVSLQDNGGIAHGGVDTSSQQMFTITVTPSNDAPTDMTLSSLEIAENLASGTTIGTFSSSDVDVGDSYTYTLVSGAGSADNASFTISNGTLRTASPFNFESKSSYSIRVRSTDAGGLFFEKQFTVNVSDVNDAPTAGSDNYALSEDVSFVTNAPGVLGNDADEDGDVLSAVLLATATNGALTLNSDGSFSYQPTANFSGTDSFSYQVIDNGSPAMTSGVATVTLTVTPVNDAPAAVADAYSTGEDSLWATNAPGVMDNDTDLDGDALTVVLVATTTNGTLLLNSNGSFSYQPSTNFSGFDSFTYRAIDSGSPALTSAVMSVVITVLPVNDAPVANGDVYSVNEDAPLGTNAPGVLGNDSDLEGNGLTAMLVASTTNGTLTLNANGSFSYQPATNFNGTDSFAYRAIDAGSPSATSALATVTLTVLPVNDAPLANADNYSVSEDSVLSTNAPGVLGNDGDLDGDNITAALVFTTTNGVLTLNANGSFSYQPSANFHGIDSFSYVVVDNASPALTSGVVVVTITVSLVNDTPMANADSYSVNEDSVLSTNAPGVLGNDTDVESDALSAELLATATNGALTLNANGSFSYQPAEHFNGIDSFTYRAVDAGVPNATSAVTTVTITVNPVNDAPLANADSYTMNEDSIFSLPASGVLANDTDVEGDAHSVVLAAMTTNGVLTLNADGSFSYMPAANFNGIDSFTYRAIDSGSPAATSAATVVSITVTPVNDAPVAQPDQTNTMEDSSVTITLLDNDYDLDGGNLLYVAEVTQGANGSVAIASNRTTVVYTPHPHVYGTDSFQYRTVDNGSPALTSEWATVTVAVIALNTAPTVNTDAYSVSEDHGLAAITTGVLVNDSDAQTNSFTAILETTTTNGMLTLNSDGSFVYQPLGHFNGIDSFQYRAVDNGVPALTSAVALVTITVTPVNDAPEMSFINPAMNSLTEDEVDNVGMSISNIVGDIISDVDADPVGIAILGLVNGNGTWQYRAGTTNWTAVGAVSGSQVLPLRAQDRIRFVPNGQNGTSARFTFCAWDQSSGTAGVLLNVYTNGGTNALGRVANAATIVVSSVNDAPVLSPTNVVMTSISEDDGNNSGMRVSDLVGMLISDVDTNAVKGIAIYGALAGNGSWQYLSGGTNWLPMGSVSGVQALLLAPNDRIRFVPDGQNGTSASLSYRAWDQTLSSAGNKADVTTNGGTTAFSAMIGSLGMTVTAINDAPVLTSFNPAMTSITEDDTNNLGMTVAAIVGSSISDVDSNAVEGIAIHTTANGRGTWQYLSGTTNWSDVGTVSSGQALLLRSNDRIRFVPDGLNNDVASFSYQAWDQTEGTAGTKASLSTNDGTSAFSVASDTASIAVTTINDAPVLTPANPALSSINEDSTNNVGVVVSTLVGASIADADTGAVEGIAIFATDNGNGKWQYALGLATNLVWMDVAIVSDAQALLLRSVDRIRFMPDGRNGTIASFTFRAWDQAAGAAGSKVNVTTNGETTAFSSMADTASVVVASANDAPVLNPETLVMTTISEDDTNNAGMVVSAIVGGAISDVDTGAVQGIAVYACFFINGTWQYSTNNGSQWNTMQSLSLSQALLLRATDRIRYAPDGRNGSVNSLLYRAWDQTLGVAGTKVNVGEGSAFSATGGTVVIGISIANDAPVTANDSASTDEDAPVTISVLSNDADVDFGDVLTVAAVTQGEHGSVTIGAGNTNVIYTPDSNFSGTDTFGYTISDGHGGTATGTVAVSVSDRPDLTTLATPAPHGLPQPFGYAEVQVMPGTVITNTVNSPADQSNGVRYICTGWNGTGDVPAKGTGTTVVAVMTTNSSLTWLWRTQYALSLVATNGSIEGAPSMWCGEGFHYDLIPHPNVSYVFGQWLIDGVAAGSAVPLSIQMNAAKTVTATFVYSPWDLDSTGTLSLVSWRTERSTGLGYGRFRLSNPASSGLLLRDRYVVAVTTSQWMRLWTPTGVAPGGRQYVDLSAAVKTALMAVGNHDQVMDPGDSVTTAEIVFYGRDSNRVVAAFCSKGALDLAQMDSDNDGIATGWEVSLGMDAHDPGDVNDDPDQDGVSSGQEFMADTDPFNGDSFLRIDVLNNHQGHDQVGWSGGSDSIQYLDWASSLEGPWSCISTQYPPTPGTNIFNRTGSGTGQGYYRIRAAR